MLFKSSGSGNSLIIDHAGIEGFGLGQGVERQAAAHAETQDSDFFLADPRQFSEIRHTVDDVGNGARNIE
jgi:hypothetical protein